MAHQKNQHHQQQQQSTTPPGSPRVQNHQQNLHQTTPTRGRTEGSLNFRNYNSYLKVKNQNHTPSILSPRRSARLNRILNFPTTNSNEEEDGEDKAEEEKKTKTTPPTPTPTATSDYYSSYSTAMANVSSSAVCVADLSSILSDELSNMSLIEEEEVLNYEIKLITIKRNFIFLPIKKKCYSLRIHCDFDFIEEQLNYKSFKINYKNLKKDVLLSIPSSFDNFTIYNSDNELIDKGSVRNNYSTFFISNPGIYKLFNYKNPIKYTEKVQELTETTITHEEITVNFPKNAVKFPFLFTMEKYSDFYYNELIKPDELMTELVIKLSPSNINFDDDEEEVQFKVKIKEFKSDCNLIVRHYHGEDYEDLKYEIIDDCVVCFGIKHFSFLRFCWELVKKIPNLVFSGSRGVKCRATMDTFNNNKFGLEISVYGQEKTHPEISNYRKVVGKSLSKVVRHGRITVVLKSSLFEADEEAGEEKEMRKMEFFNGNDLNFMFALRFITEFDGGPFGKVLVSLSSDTIFEFNIQKNNLNQDEEEINNDEENEENNGNNFSVVNVTRELATNLFILDGNNWRLLAKHLGFTKKEIKSKFKSNADPFRSLVETYRARGGTDAEFVTAMYEIHREIKIGMGAVGGGSPNSLSSRGSNRSSGLGSSLRNSGNNRNKPFRRFGEVKDSSSSSSSEEDNNNVNLLRGTSTGVDSVLSKMSPHPSTSSSNNLPTTRRGKRKAPLPPPPQLPPHPSKKKRKSKRRKHYTESDDEEEESRSSSSSEEESRKHHRHHNRSITNSKHSSLLMRENGTLLDTKFFWGLSCNLTTGSWKALGRTLELEESQISTIEQTHRNQGNRELNYQVLISWKENFPKRATFGTLYSALCTENLVSVARKMTRILNETRGNS